MYVSFNLILHGLSSRREVLVREAENSGDEPIDVIPNEFEVLTTDQEYGGQGFSVSGDTVVFSNHQDQRLYKYNFLNGGGETSIPPLPITPDYGGPVVRYADGVFDVRSNRYITVMEDHRKSSSNPTALIAAVNLDSDDIEEPKVLVSGNDFYSFPRMDPSGQRLAWIEWSDPNMHWDKSQLWVGYISDKGDLGKRICIAGGDPMTRESPTEPKWSPKGELFFITDRHNGFWNIYKWICGPNCLYLEGASPIYPLSIAKVTLDVEKLKAVGSTIIWSSSPESIEYKSYFSLPEFIEYPTEIQGQNAYAYFYPPYNPNFQATQEERPPLLLRSHGGPTDESRAKLDLNIQYWTS